MNDQTKIPAGFVSAGDASRILGVSTTTLRSRDTTKHRIIYARVSTRKQQENLQRQVDFLQSKYPTYELIRDFGSGINFKRRGFTKVLDYAIEGNLEELVVAYRDRLCRIGFEFIKTLFDKLSGTSIVVLDEGTGSQTKNWYKISSQSLQFSPLQSTVEKDTKKITTIKVRLFPTMKEKKTLNRWFGMGRYVYNNALVSLKVITKDNPLNPLYQAKVERPKCKFVFTKGKKKGTICGKECNGEFCRVHLPKLNKCKTCGKACVGDYCKPHFPNKCTFEFKSGKRKGTVCGYKCEGQICSSHSNRLSNGKLQKKWTGRANKITRISIRDFVQKIKINDSVDFFADTKKERKELLEDFAKTLDNPEYEEKKMDTMWKPDWCTDMPSRMYRGMVGLLKQDINSCLSNGNLDLNIRLKTKRDDHFVLQSEQWCKESNPFPIELENVNGYYKIGRKRVQLSELFQNVEKQGYQTIRDEFGRYWLNLAISPECFMELKKTKKKMKRDETQIPKHFPACSLDPGVRTFQTVYGLNHIVEIGSDASIRVLDLLEKRDEFWSKRDLYGNVRKNQKRLRKVGRKLKGLVDDLHRKTISFLTSTYDTILLPSFETSKMVKGKTLQRKTKRQLLSLRFYAFKQRMIDKCKKKGVDLRIVSEAFTTKCCRECGELTSVGGSEIYSCGNKECLLYGVRIGRDFQGASNIMIRNLL
jgi:DNA invertase Pin-like site-specific DNA recombinase